MHQGCLSVDILHVASKEAWRLLWFPMHGGKHGWGDVAVVESVKCKNPWVLPPFPNLEGVLAIETSDLGIIDGWDNTGETSEGVTRLIIDCA